MVWLYEQRNNCPKDADQGKQAMFAETITHMVTEAVLQVMENTFNLRMAAMEQAIKDLTLPVNNGSSKRLIARELLKEPIKMDNLGIIIMKRYIRSSIVKQHLRASIIKQYLIT